LDALDRVHLGKEVREHRRLVAAAGADFQRFTWAFISQDELDHASDHERMRDGLAEADRQRVVLVGAAGERLLDEEVPRHAAERGEHALVADALRAPARDHARAGGLRRHAETAPGATSGTLTWKSTPSPNAARARRSTSSSATPMADSKCSPALLVSDTASEGMPSR